jgi:2-polyprenyl-3-methyl-5-hydroxy-6-metoxy-1,4-benzoquinol methylase
MEEARKQAAKLGAGETLRQLYEPEYAFLRQGQVQVLWDDLLLHNKDHTPEFTLWRNKMSVKLVPTGTKRLLEVGIGMGHALQNMVQRLPKVEIYGTDISEQAVLRASARFKGNFAVADLGEMPWQGQTFDAIVMLEVLEHVEVPRTFGVLAWLHSLLNEDGSLIVSVPLETVTGLRQEYFACPHCGQLVHQIGHVRSYSDLQPVGMELALSGFRVERTLGIAGGRYFGVRRQTLMPFFPNRVKPMVMVFRARKQGTPAAATSPPESQ